MRLQTISYSSIHPAMPVAIIRGCGKQNFAQPRRLIFKQVALQSESATTASHLHAQSFIRKQPVESVKPFALRGGQKSSAAFISNLFHYADRRCDERNSATSVLNGFEPRLAARPFVVVQGIKADVERTEIFDLAFKRPVPLRQIHALRTQRAASAYDLQYKRVFIGEFFQSRHYLFKVRKRCVRAYPTYYKRRTCLA